MAQTNPGSANGDPTRGNMPQAGQQQSQPNRGEEQEQQLERAYKVRQVTDYQASWTEQGRGGNGRFNIQLILDNGVEEYILQVTAEDLDVLLTLLKRSDHTMFDRERKVLMFSNIDAS